MYFKSRKIHSGHLNRSAIVRTDCGKRLMEWDVEVLGAHISDEDYESNYCAGCKRSWEG